MPTPRKRILIALHWYSLETHAGIGRYALSAQWDAVVVNNENKGDFPPGSYDGIICLAPDESHPMHEFIANARVPVVELSYSYPQHKQWGRVPIDAYVVGRTAATHLLKCPVHSFLFVSIRTNETHELRWSAFKKALSKDNRPVGRFATDSLNHLETEKLAAFLKTSPLPRPVGVVGSFDESARQVYDAAMLADLKVPGDLYLMGTDNNEICTKICPVPITTIEVNKEARGFAGAELLDLLMAGKAQPGFIKAHPSGEVIIRESTGGFASDNPVCDKAIAIMNANVVNPLNVDELAGQLGIGKRSLDRIFIKVTGLGVAAFYLKLRLELSKGLLLSGAKTESVADMVGFRAYSSYRLAFNKLEGCSPKEFVLRGRASEHPKKTPART